MAERLKLKDEHFVVQKQMLQMLQNESDRRKGLADWYADTGSYVAEGGKNALPLSMDLSDAALTRRGKPKLGRRGSSFVSPPAANLEMRKMTPGPRGEDFSNLLGQQGRPPGSAMVSLEVALPLPTGVTPPTCDEGASCRDGVELPPLEKLAIMCENLPSNVYDCNAEIGVTIPEFLIKTPDMMSALYPDYGYIKLYEAFGGLDQSLIKMRDELIENPRELSTLSEYCTALRAKGDTWEAIDCFLWSMELVKTEQYDKSSGRWAQINTEGEFTTLGAVVTNLKINYGETLLRAGLVDEALAAFESTSAEEWFKGREGASLGEHYQRDNEADQAFSQELTMGKLALGHARDITATHTVASAREYVKMIERQNRGGQSSWRLHHSPDWYMWRPVVVACRWVFGSILIMLLFLRAAGLRPWVQWPSLPCLNSAPSHLALCCEWGGAVYVLHSRVLLPLVDRDNVGSLAAATAARNGGRPANGSDDSTQHAYEPQLSPVFLAHQRHGEGNTGQKLRNETWWDVEVKVELPVGQAVGHLELMKTVALPCCCVCRRGGRALCYSVAYTFADLDIKLLRSNSAEPRLGGSKRRSGETLAPPREPVGGWAPRALPAIRLGFVSETLFGTSQHEHTLHMNEGSGVFRLLSAVQNESKLLDQGVQQPRGGGGGGGGGGRARRRR
jgi:hypothetical protein